MTAGPYWLNMDTADPGRVWTVEWVGDDGVDTFPLPEPVTATLYDASNTQTPLTVTVADYKADIAVPTQALGQYRIDVYIESTTLFATANLTVHKPNPPLPWGPWPTATVVGPAWYPGWGEPGEGGGGAGATGPTGPTGPASTVPGPTGPTGPAGADGGGGGAGPTGPTGPVSTVPGPTGPTGPAGEGGGGGGIPVFADAAARDAAIPAPTDGMFAWLSDTSYLTVFRTVGGADTDPEWHDLIAPADWGGVGIAGGAITNSKGIAIGQSTITGTEGGVTIGNLAKGYGAGSVAIGPDSRSGGVSGAMGTHCTAVGDTAKALANNSIAIGAYSEATAENSFAIGYEAESTVINTGVIGTAAHTVDIPGTLTVKGVPVMAALGTAMDMITALKAEIASLREAGR